MAIEAGTATRAPVSRGAAAFLVALLALTVALFAWLAQRSAGGRRDPAAGAAEVSLGAAFERGTFRMRVALQLDAARSGELRREVEARREALRSIVNLEIVYRRPEADFAGGQPIVETLRLEIRDRLNRELQAAGFGAGAIVSVLTPELSVPAGE